MRRLLWHFEEGGPGMWPILLCGIVALVAASTAMRRLWARRPSALGLIGAIERALADGDVDGALLYVGSARTAAERVVLAGLRESLQPGPRIDAAVASALVAELPSLRVGQRTLGTITQLATLFGLLGTITGLSMPFCCNGCPDASSRAAMLARGISESMNCTAFGLFVSTLALGLGFVIEARATMLRKELELVARATANRLAEHRAVLRWLGARPINERPTYREAA